MSECVCVWTVCGFTCWRCRAAAACRARARRRAGPGCAAAAGSAAAPLQQHRATLSTRYAHTMHSPPSLYAGPLSHYIVLKHYIIER